MLSAIRHQGERHPSPCGVRAFAECVPRGAQPSAAKSIPLTQKTAQHHDFGARIGFECAGHCCCATCTMQCPDCPRSFTRAARLSKHRLKHAAPPGMLPCPGTDCNKVFQSGGCAGAAQRIDSLFVCLFSSVTLLCPLQTSGWHSMTSLSMSFLDSFWYDTKNCTMTTHSLATSPIRQRSRSHSTRTITR